MKEPKLKPHHKKLMAVAACFIILGFALYLFITAYFYA